ncbi:MAG: hypothetical protein IJW53_05640 [Clostridia bacterium]|nr:hypothetical protein [Clostridia bacterium]
MASKSITAQFEALPKLVKVLILIVLGVVVSGVYRIVRYLETKNIVTLVAGILCFTGIGFVIGIIDAVTEILSNKITLLAD